MLPKPKPLLRCAAALLCLAAAPLHAVQMMGFAVGGQASPASDPPFMETLDLSRSVSADGALTFTLDLRFGAHTARPVTGIAALVHYNSAKMEFLGISNIAPAATGMPNPQLLLRGGYRQNPPTITLNGETLTADTDRALPLAWFDLDGIAAAAGATRENPVRVATLIFKWKDTAPIGDAHIAVTRSALGTRDGFTGVSARIQSPATAVVTASPAALEAGVQSDLIVTCLLTRPARAETTCTLDSRVDSINDATIKIAPRAVSGARTFTITESAGELSISLRSIDSPLVVRNPKPAVIALKEPKLLVSPRTIITEEGRSADIRVRLSVRPKDGNDVVVNAGITLADTEAAISPASLTFTASDWAQNQSVRVSSMEDMQVDGDKDYTITLSVDKDASAMNYHDKTGTVTGRSIDTTSPSMLLSVEPEYLLEAKEPQRAVVTAKLFDGVYTDETTVNLTQSKVDYQDQNTDYKDFQPPAIVIPPNHSSASVTFEVTVLLDEFHDIADSRDAIGFVGKIDNPALTDVTTLPILDPGVAGLRMDTTALPLRLGEELTANPDIPAEYPLTIECSLRHPILIPVLCILKDDGSAMPGPNGDYTVNPPIVGATITIEPRRKSGSRKFMVETTKQKDRVNSADGKTISVSIASARSAGLTLGAIPNRSVSAVLKKPALDVLVSQSALDRDRNRATLHVRLSAPAWINPQSGRNDIVRVVVRDVGREREHDLVFNSGNWDTPQRVDFRGSAEVSVNTRLTASSSYNLLAETVAVSADGTKQRILSLSAEPNKLPEEGGEQRVAITADFRGFEPGFFAEKKQVTLRLDGGTATQSEDYTLDSLPAVTFSPQGMTATDASAAATFPISLIRDETLEGDETIIIAGALDGHPDIRLPVIMLTIADQAVPVLQVSKTQLSTSEEKPRNDDFQVRLGKEPTGNVEVLITTDNPGEANPQAVHLLFAAHNWDKWRTVKVLGVDDDAVVDGDQNYTINLAVSPRSAAREYHGKTASIPGVNRDNDAGKLELTLTADPNTLFEPARADRNKQQVTLTATLSGGVLLARDTRVTINRNNDAGTATGGAKNKAGSDYKKFQPPETITIPRGEKSAGVTFPVVIWRDDLNDDEETIIIEGRLPGDSRAPQPPPASLTVTIRSAVDLDVDESGRTSFGDATMIWRYTLGVRGEDLTKGVSSAPHGEVEMRIAALLDENNRLDVNEDGEVTDVDLNLVFSYMAGLRGNSLDPDLNSGQQRNLESNIARLLQP